MRRFAGVVRDTAGNALSSPTINVYVATATSTAATVFSDNAYTALANPFTGNTDGSWRFYARDGRYLIEVTRTGFTFSTVPTADELGYDPFSAVSAAVTTATTTSFNDYAPTNGANAHNWRLASTAAIQLTGLAITGSSFYGRWLTIINLNSSAGGSTGGGDIALMNENAGSTAANRIITGTTGTVTLAPDGVATLFYDITSTRWRLVNKHPTT